MNSQNILETGILSFKIGDYKVSCLGHLLMIPYTVSAIKNATFPDAVSRPFRYPKPNMSYTKLIRIFLILIIRKLLDVWSTHYIFIANQTHLKKMTIPQNRHFHFKRNQHFKLNRNGMQTNN